MKGKNQNRTPGLLLQQGALKKGVGSGLQMEPSWASREAGRHLPRSCCSLGPAWELSTGCLTGRARATVQIGMHTGEPLPLLSLLCRTSPPHSTLF